MVKSPEEMMQSLLGDIKAKDELSQARANMTPEQIKLEKQLERAGKKAVSEHLGPLERRREQIKMKTQAGLQSKHKRTSRGQINLHGSLGRKPDEE